MRDAALPLLSCPSCRGALTLDAASAVREADGHVMEGSLACGCGRSYPIVRGIPRFAETNETAARFGEQWHIFDEVGTQHEEWFRAWLEPVGPEDFRGKIVLEGGCGKGRHTVVAASWGAKALIALDLGNAVEVAFRHGRALENVHVVQGNILTPPVARVVDLAFSIGVLHHMPDPRAGFDALRSAVKPGGRVAIWVYGYESNEWIVRWVNPVRERVTARMPHRLLYWLTYGTTAAMAPALSLYRTPLADRLPYSGYLKALARVPFREVHNIVYDQLVTPIAHYLPEAEVRSWFAQKGLAETQIAWHRGMSWRANARVV